MTAPEHIFPRHVLEGWVCILRLNINSCADPIFFTPNCIHEALSKDGWVEIDPEADWDGSHNVHITDAGMAVADLCGAEWGIDVIPDVAEEDER